MCRLGVVGKGMDTFGVLEQPMYNSMLIYIVQSSILISSIWSGPLSNQSTCSQHQKHSI